MIKNFVKISLKNSSEKIVEEIQTRKSLVLNYPCSNSHSCTPYVIELSKGVYKFECWGSKGGGWSSSAITSQKSTPGLGGYTAGNLFVQKPTKFFVYIGNVGFFNAAKEMTHSLNGAFPGGATDVRLNYSENWWDNYSLISRIMVAAGGGGAEWAASIGGNGGGLIGGESTSADSSTGSGVFEDRCQGATQTNSSNCVTFEIFVNDVFTPCSAVPGQFGSSTIPDPIIHSGDVSDWGGFGGGGYYGGTSYQYTFAGSGGSSFISGHEECNAVKDQTEVIEHTNTPFHYSGFVFTNTEMISGNETMPLPTDPTKRGTYNGEGAFRITILFYHYQCTYKRSLYASFFQNLLFIFVYINK